MRFLLLLLSLLFVNSIVVRATSNISFKSSILKNYQDSISLDTIQQDTIPMRILKVTDFFSLIVNSDKKKRDKKGLLVLDYQYEPFPDYFNFSDTMIFAPEFLPIVFDGKLIDTTKIDFIKPSFSEYKSKSPDYFLIDRDSIVGMETIGSNRDLLLDAEESIDSFLANSQKISNTRKEYYVQNPSKVKVQSSDLRFQLPKKIIPTLQNNPFKQLITSDELFVETPSVNKQKIKQRYWKFKLSNNLDLSQTNYTDNWESQGSSSTQINSLQRVDVLYRKNKIEFTHWTEWKLSLQRWALTDEEKQGSKSELLLNEDYLRTYNKLGIDAFVKKWSYILTLDVKTPLFVKKDKDDKNKRIASLLSPLELNLGVGAGYKLAWTSKKNENRRLNISVDASPLSIQTTYVSNDEVWNNNHYNVVYDGERAGERRYSKTEFGSTLNLTIDYKINSFISLYSRNKFFSNYHKVLIENENTLSFILNKYISTKLYFYGKFNDGVDQSLKDPKLGYFSYTDSLRFGLSFKW